MRGIRAIATSALLAVALVTPPARSAPTASAGGPEKQACVDAATRGQIQRDDLKLSAAAEAFSVCAAASCPTTVRKSCAEWLEAVRGQMPTVTVRLADAASATLLIDGATASFAAATTLDPGPHSLRVEALNKPALEQDFRLVPGDHKTIDLRFPEPRPPPTIETRPVPLPVWILGGVGAAGIASWAVFGLMATSETNRLTKDCAPRCTADARDGAFRLATIADVSLIVGAVAAIAAGVFYLTRPTVQKPAPSTGLARAGTFSFFSSP